MSVHAFPDNNKKNFMKIPIHNSPNFLFTFTGIPNNFPANTFDVPSKPPATTNKIELNNIDQNSERYYITHEAAISKEIKQLKDGLKK